MMVFLTLLALFSFVVLPALDTYMRRGGGMNSDPVAATFDGVELTRARVARTTQNHAAVVRFLSELAGETINRGGVPQTPGFQYDEQSGQIQSLGIDSNPGEEATVNTLRFYNEAQKAGFELDDAAIGNWLTRFTDGTVSDGEMIAMLLRSSGNQLGQQHLYEQLRMHLLADLYQRSSLVGLTNGQIPVVTPLGLWENFLKLNRNATVNAYGVLVSEYLDQTDDNPSESDIEEVYEEGKERLSYPGSQSPLPAFAQPDSAVIEWVAADLQSFIDAEKAKLSEEEIRAEYERRIAGGDFQLPVESEEEAGEEAPTESDVEEATEPATENSEESGADASEESVEESDAGDEGESETPAVEESSSNSSLDNSVRLVMFQDESAGAEEEPATAEESAKEDIPAEETAEETAAEEDSTEETPAEEESAEEESAQDSEEMADESETAAEESEEADGLEMADDAEETTSLELDDEPETRPQSFEEVRDEIATDMVVESARNALDRAITEANKRMRLYFSQRAVHESNVSVGVQKEEDAPKPLDLKEMAKELGMEYGSTDGDLVNRVSVEDVGPGASYGLGTGFNRRGPPFSAMMFGAPMQDGTVLPPQPEFSPLRSVDLEQGVSYISWKTEDVPSSVPELDDVRDEVVLYIRTREARELAKKAAEELAATAGEGDKSLSEIIPEGKEENLIENVGPFSWLEQLGFMQTVIAEVPQLDAVGDEFMQAVFTTELGEYGVASNDPQSVYYVVTPTEFQPEVEELQEQFRQPQQRFMAQLLGNQDARNIVRGFYESVDERTGFEMRLSNDE
ncbi:MAG: hypothetical protein ACF787_06680 [Rhodopirellula sp. JB053]